MTFTTLVTLTRSLLLIAGLTVLSVAGSRTALTLWAPAAPVDAPAAAPSPRDPSGLPLRSSGQASGLAADARHGRRVVLAAVLALQLPRPARTVVGTVGNGTASAVSAPDAGPLGPLNDPMLASDLVSATALLPACGRDGCLLRHLRGPLDGGVDRRAGLGASEAADVDAGGAAGGARIAVAPPPAGGPALGALSALLLDVEWISGPALPRAALRAAGAGRTWRSRAQAIHSL